MMPFQPSHTLATRASHLLKLKRCKSSSTYDYQFLQRSRIPTMHFQPSLPRLPIPELKNTCTRYLAAQRPLLSDNDYQTTEKYVSEFRSSGKQLQELLRENDKKNKHTSYITEAWFDMYLRDRVPLPINYNPALIFQNDTNDKYNTQAVKAANILISSLRFLKSLNNGILNPDVFHLNPKKSDTDLFRRVTSALPASLSWYAAYLFKAYPLDMSQYKNLFCSTRVPHVDKDHIYRNPDSRHVLVMYKGHFYVFDVLDKDGNIFPPKYLFSNISYILNRKETNQFPLGILTTQERNTWASVRKHVVGLGNEEAFHLIDSAIMNIVLDDVEVGNDPNAVLRHFLFAQGNNRWFDKSFSLIVAKDGLAGVNFEHSWGDGVAVLRYFEEVYSDSTNQPQIHPDTKVDQEQTVRHLSINLDDTAKSSIKEAATKHQSISDSIIINYVLLQDMGKQFCKTKLISPDAVMQIGFQLAYHKQYGNLDSVYESCSTAAFKHGRTEAIRPCTILTKEFCEKVNSQNTSKSSLKSLLIECSKKHGQLTKEAALGQGFDRHLYALRLYAEKQGKSLPGIFRDPAYASLNRNVLSTSTLSSPAVYAGGFGPVVKDGYGIAYMIRDNELGALVTNYSSYRDSKHYVECLEKSYDEIRSILLS